VHRIVRGNLRASGCSIRWNRVSELLFGLFMALTFVGAVSVGQTGRRYQKMLAPPWAATLPGASSTRSCTWFARSPIAAGRLRWCDPFGPPGRGNRPRIIARSQSMATAGLIAEPRDRGDPRADRRAAVRAGATVLDMERPARRPRGFSDRGRVDLSVVLPFVLLAMSARRRRSPAPLPGDAVLRRPRVGPIRGVRKLEGRAHDGRPGHGARGRGHGARRMSAA